MRQIHSGNRVERSEWNDAKGDVVYSDDSRRNEYLKSVKSNLEESIVRFRQVIASLDKTVGDYTVDDVISKYL